MITEHSGNFDDFEKDLEALLREHNQSRAAALDRERELNIYRSGSAPPTVEGSKTAIRNLLGPANGEDLLSDEELRAHPDFLSYHYSNDKLNPRMPPPLVSKEDWRLAQRFRTANSAIGDRWRKGVGEGDGSGSSLFSMQPGLPRGDDGKRELKEDWGNGGLIGLADVGLGARRRSFTDAIREDLVHLPSVSAHPSRPVSRNSYGTSNDLSGLSDVQFAQIHNGMDAVGGLRSRGASPGLVRVQSLGSTMSQSFASAVGSSLSRSTTPDPHLMGRSSSLSPPVGEMLIDAEKKIVTNGFGGAASHMADCGDIAVALSGMNLSKNIQADGENHVHGHLHHKFVDQPDGLYHMRNDHYRYLHQMIMAKPESESLHAPTIPSVAHNGFSNNTGILKDLSLSALASNGQMSLQEQSSSTNLSKKVSVVGSNSLAGSSGHYLTNMANIDFVGCSSNSFQALPAVLNNQIDDGAGLASGSEEQYLSRTGSRLGSAFQAPVMDPLYAQYLQRASDYTTDLSDHSANHMDMSGYNKAYLGALLAQQRLPHDGSYMGQSGCLNYGFYGNAGVGLHMPYPTLIPGSPLRQNDPLSRLPSALRSGTAGSKGSWNHVNDIMEQGFASSLLEEFKINKTSGDQYGSRFIQQKLETATIEEKNKLFPEILAHARVLMTMSLEIMLYRKKPKKPAGQ